MASNVPSNIIFLGITLPTSGDVFIASLRSGKQFQRLWVMTDNVQRCWCTHYGNASLVGSEEPCEVYPKLKIQIQGKAFKPGDMFMFKDIRFVIVNEEYAVALDPIMKLSLSDLPERDEYSDTCYFPDSCFSKKLNDWL